jgi:hypothetical protein
MNISQLWKNASRDQANVLGSLSPVYRHLISQLSIARCTDIGDGVPDTI